MSLTVLDLNNLKPTIISLSKSYCSLTKRQIVRHLFDEILQAKQDGVPYYIIAKHLRDNGINISDGYLIESMRHIRKERGLSLRRQQTEPCADNKSLDAIQTDNKEIINSSAAINNQSEIDINSLTIEERKAIWDKINAQSNSATSYEEKYRLLGGDISEIKQKPISKQRALLSALRIKQKKLYVGVST
ncbi:hypothetical protein ETN89_19720 (plasmid) [Photobacterium damselae subsp. damselae]|uniref:hypothetical protein n=1 Tax=Photobacterium damselae TaxID=38293 RepID=UPI000A2F9D44|nr:hypothetical protein [Photobacterium damselae]ARR51812.1 hypothetical protein CAY62_20570 [Photobacterium damselae subsp. damselae]QAY37497.1 hypothetical protein ETN89_19720 [Photobacterium damselae subsp. damselae]